MRIVLDLQGVQSDSELHGIGRYSLLLAQAIAREAGRHEVWLALSGRFPDTVEPLRDAFASLIPSERIRVFELPGPVAEWDLTNAWRMQAAELLRENFLADLQPDIVHVSTLFEGFDNEVVASVGRLNTAVPTAVTLYDLISLLRPENYPEDSAKRRYYVRRAQSLKRADLILAATESSSRDAADTLHISPSRIVNLAAGVQPWFQSSAQVALRAFEALDAERKATHAVMLNSVTMTRPLLALVTPLPPERTGIAGYTARLLPNLARHYEIVCIVDQPEVVDPSITAEFAIRDVRWFEANAGCFERVMYQFGNSRSHKHMFGLLERHPGVAVLHDFYLGDLLDWMTDSGYAPGSITKALYCSHGFSALEKDRAGGREASIAAFPCNASVLRESTGVVVHSKHAISLACEWYGDQVAARFRQVPFLPFAPETVDRVAARKSLSLPENAFVVSSFGWVTPMKLNDRVLEAWLASPLAKDKTCFLIFVGENHGGDYGKQLSERIAASDSASRIRITGYVEASQYRDYIAAADLAVQLRAGSRGETSATVFDCLARKVPLIINAHGWAAELPDDAVMKLDDAFAGAMLSASIARLRDDPDLLRSLVARGALYLNEVHHPERIAELYRNIIEDLYTNGSHAHEQKLVQAITRISTSKGPTEADLATVATALAANSERFGPPQILLDVTIVADSDLRTGVQRVTRAILMALIADPPPGYRIEPVRAFAGRYLYARQFACRCLALAEDGLTDDPVETGRADIFIGLDWCGGVIRSLSAWFLEQRRHGAQIVFIAYDMLPLLRPEFFPPDMVSSAVDWISTAAEVATGVVCISRTVADELYEWLTKTKPLRPRPLSLGFFHLGADMHASLPTNGVSEDAAAVLGKLRSRPSFLMVGTVEPRKGHRQALEAMELLWADGVDTNLAIVGKRGWMIDDMAERIQQHPELDNRLFWLQGISEELLEQVYCTARALLATSEGEGFGLPLVEAAQYGLPIIARDIPVFREMAGKHAYYFSGENAQALADALRDWLRLGEAVPPSTEIPWVTWQESSRQLLDVALGKRWYRSWPDTARKFPVSHIASHSECAASISFPKEFSFESGLCGTELS